MQPHTSFFNFALFLVVFCCCFVGWTSRYSLGTREKQRISPASFFSYYFSSSLCAFVCECAHAWLWEFWASALAKRLETINRRFSCYTILFSHVLLFASYWLWFFSVFFLLLRSDEDQRRVRERTSVHWKYCCFCFWSIFPIILSRIFHLKRTKGLFFTKAFFYIRTTHDVLPVCCCLLIVCLCFLCLLSEKCSTILKSVRVG